MRTTHFKRLVLVLAIQWILYASVLRFDHTSLDWLAGICVPLGLIIPCAGYIWALYDAPMGAHVPRLAKTLTVGLIACGLTIFGLVADMIVFTMFGVPIRSAS